MTTTMTAEQISDRLDQISDRLDQIEEAVEQAEGRAWDITDELAKKPVSVTESASVANWRAELIGEQDMIITKNRALRSEHARLMKALSAAWAG